MTTGKSRERQALEEIIMLLEPLNWECPDHPCQGCEYERNEALAIAMNIVSGLDAYAHLGPPIPHKRTAEGTLLHREDPEYVAERTRRTEILHEAWRAAGFTEVKSQGRTVWRRPDRFGKVV